MKNTEKNLSRNDFIQLLRTELGPDLQIISRKQLIDFCESHNLKRPWWFQSNPKYSVGRGKYLIPKIEHNPSNEGQNSAMSEQTKVVTVNPQQKDLVDRNTYIPEKQRGYVPFGHFQDVQSIISSGIFYPTFITGLSGNGKTEMVRQACAKSGRELIRTNITVETDEDDLIGGFRLINGETVWQDGPVVIAMKRGAVLLLDEVDLASNKIMCLQPVLEGNSIYLKKISTLVHPKDGFNIFATANTKGRGSDDGKYIGTNIQNEAFLERFAITMEQDFPSFNSEIKILKNLTKERGLEDDAGTLEFINILASWALKVRDSFYRNAIDEIISTRRLIHIMKAYFIFKNRMKAVELCVARFDDEVKKNLVEFYAMCDESIKNADKKLDSQQTWEIKIKFKEHDASYLNEEIENKMVIAGIKHKSMKVAPKGEMKVLEVVADDEVSAKEIYNILSAYEHVGLDIHTDDRVVVEADQVKF